MQHVHLDETQVKQMREIVSGAIGFTLTFVKKELSVRGHRAFVLACVAPLALGVMSSVAVRAQESDLAILQAAQNKANTVPGPRNVPARVIPLPKDVDPATAALMAAPYWQPVWNANPPDNASWRAIVKQSAAEPRGGQGLTRRHDQANDRGRR